MRILGVDFGHKRIGLALSDETGTVASPLTYIDGGGIAAVSREIARISAERQVGKIVVGVPLRVHGSGRTDAGVHARGQVANCTLRTQLKVPTLLKALNANLPEDVRVLRLRVTDAKFHARFSARGKEYRYQIDGGAVADPFLRA